LRQIVKKYPTMENIRIFVIEQKAAYQLKETGLAAGNKMRKMIHDYNGSLSIPQIRSCKCKRFSMTDHEDLIKCSFPFADQVDFEENDMIIEDQNDLSIVTYRSQDIEVCKTSTMMFTDEYFDIDHNIANVISCNFEHCEQFVEKLKRLGFKPVGGEIKQVVLGVDIYLLSVNSFDCPDLVDEKDIDLS
jgi:hypothetical protein